MTCKICGTELLDNAKFCTNCGAKVEEVTAEVVSTSSTESAAPEVNETVNEAATESNGFENNAEVSQSEVSNQKINAERVEGQIVDEGRHFDNGAQSYSQNASATQGYSQNVNQGYQSSTQSAPSGGATPTAPTGPKGFAIASLVCGIVSLLCCCCSPIAIICAGVAVGLGIYVITTGLPGKEMAIAGIVCGGIGLFIFLISMIFSATGAFSNLTNALDLSDIIENL